MLPVSYSESDQKLLKSFGARVKRQRRRRGLSQEEIAFRSGLHRTYVGSVERGERNVALLSIRKLAKALECTPGDLLRR